MAQSDRQCCRESLPVRTDAWLTSAACHRGAGGSVRLIRSATERWWLPRRVTLSYPMFYNWFDHPLIEGWLVVKGVPPRVLALGRATIKSRVVHQFPEGRVTAHPVERRAFRVPIVVGPHSVLERAT